MEIVHLINNTYQLVDSFAGTIIMQGTYDECFARLAAIDQEQEHDSYASFLTMSGF